MKDVNGNPAPVADHVFALLDRTLRRLREDMTERGRRLPPEALATGVGTLRSSQLRLLDLTPEAGMRVTDLAQHAGMTAQALGEFVRPLVERGFLTVERDPADRRARIVRRTTAGTAVSEAADAMVRAMEADWRARVGPDDWDVMRRVMLAVVTAPDDAATAATGATAPARGPAAGPAPARARRRRPA